MSDTVIIQKLDSLDVYEHGRQCLPHFFFERKEYWMPSVTES